MNPHARIGIVGGGLLGGSLGMAARRLGLAQEVVGLQPDIILATATPATVALQRQTRTTRNARARCGC